MRRLELSVAVVLLAGGCVPGESAYVNLTSGLVVKGVGLGCDEVQLLIDGKRVTSRDFTFGQKVSIEFVNVTGLTPVESRLSPRLRLRFLTEGGEDLHATGDLLASGDGFPVTDSLLIKGTFGIGTPLQSGSRYRLVAEVSDSRGDGTLRAEVFFRVEPNPHITIESNGLTAREVFLLAGDPPGVLLENRLLGVRKLSLVFEGPAGFRQESGKVFFQGQIEIKDGAATVSRYDVVFGESGATGLPVDDFYVPGRQLTLALTLEERFVSPLEVRATILDLRSDASITARLDLWAE